MLRYSFAPCLTFCHKYGLQSRRQKHDPDRMRIAISTGAHRLIPPYGCALPRVGKAGVRLLAKIAETASSTSQNSIASAFFLRSSFSPDSE
jgi:hypothetical protein